MENHSLIERIKIGNGDDTLKEIYNKYQNEFIMWAMRRHSCTMEEAKDVFQQAMIIFYENVVHGKITELTVQVKTYLFSIGKNKILETFRQRSKTHIPVEDSIEVGMEMFGDEIDEEYEEKLKMVEKGLSKLGDPCKNILEFYYYHKKSMNEISKIMDYKSGGTVKNLKYKCLQRLKQIFTSGFSTLN